MRFKGTGESGEAGAKGSSEGSDESKGAGEADDIITFGKIPTELKAFGLRSFFVKY